jgi:hypothetical protein
VSLLPQQMLPPTQPLCRQDPAGLFIIDKNWWLFFYNIYVNTFGSQGLTGDDVFGFEQSDIDVAGVDTAALRQPIENLQVGLEDALPSPLPDTSAALLLAQCDDLVPAAPVAQPFLALTPGASPWGYTALFSGSVAITGGTVSDIALARQGTSIATGLIAGLIPVSRGDTVTVTYSVVPTATFIPGAP